MRIWGQFHGHQLSGASRGLIDYAVGYQTISATYIRMSFHATKEVIEVEYIEDVNILALYIEWAQRVQTSSRLHIDRAVLILQRSALLFIRWGRTNKTNQNRTNIPLQFPIIIILNPSESRCPPTTGRPITLLPKKLPLVAGNRRIMARSPSGPTS